jgi:hypothetical protein
MVSFELIHRLPLLSQLHQRYLEGFIIYKHGVDRMLGLLRERTLDIGIDQPVSDFRHVESGKEAADMSRFDCILVEQICIIADRNKVRHMVRCIYILVRG